MGNKLKKRMCPLCFQESTNESLSAHPPYTSMDDDGSSMFEARKHARDLLIRH